tara:strand:+ start:845 stop:1210 length:366 start_codon:yes stop_codon:yes gene_type:complete
MAKALFTGRLHLIVGALSLDTEKEASKRAGGGMCGSTVPKIRVSMIFSYTCGVQQRNLWHDTSQAREYMGRGKGNRWHQGRGVRRDSAKTRRFRIKFMGNGLKWLAYSSQHVEQAKNISCG